MMTKDEALKITIELMERFLEYDGISSSDYIDVLDACKEALEQPAQEHVLLNVKTHDDKTYKVEVSAPLWQGLSDDEKRKIWFKLEHEIGESILYGGKLSDAIEQALKEKNT